MNIQAPQRKLNYPSGEDPLTEEKDFVALSDKSIYSEAGLLSRTFLDLCNLKDRQGRLPGTSGRRWRIRTPHIRPKPRRGATIATSIADTGSFRNIFFYMETHVEEHDRFCFEDEDGEDVFQLLCATCQCLRVVDSLFSFTPA